MNVKHKKLMTTALLLLSLAGCKLHAPRTEQADYKHPGDQWLSWTARERINFVYGYIEGYGEGMDSACLAADKLFERDKPHSLGYNDMPSTLPSARCRANIGQYSNLKVSVSIGPEFNPYSDVITTFYTKHPEYRDVQFSYLMTFLTAEKHKTADDLYSMAKSGKLAIAPR